MINVEEIISSDPKEPTRIFKVEIDEKIIAFTILKTMRKRFITFLNYLENDKTPMETLVLYLREQGFEENKKKTRVK